MVNKITHEQAEYSLRSLVAKFVIPSVEETSYGALYDYSHFYNILDDDENQHLKNVEDYISQQEKQEKLLELYKGLLKRVNLKFYSKGGEWVNFEKYLLENKTINDNTSLAEIFKQIKELEDE